MRSTGARFGRIVSGAIGAVLVALVGLPGCGKVGGIPVDETASRIANTICPKAWMCCTADQLSSNSAAGTSEQDCITQTTSSYKNQLSTLQVSIDQKRASYQSSKVDTCLMTIQSSDCTALNVTNHVVGIPGCESFTTPLVAVGGACSQNYECIGGWCNVPSARTTARGSAPRSSPPASRARPRVGRAAVRTPSATSKGRPTTAPTISARPSPTSGAPAPTTCSAPASTAARAAAAG